MSSRHSRKSKSLAAKSAELAFAVPQVVAHRVTRMAIAGPTLSERDRKEFKLMSDEKTAAFAESWNAMTVHALQANQALASSLMRSMWTPFPGRQPSAGAIAAQAHRAALDVLDKGLSPVHRKAVANAKRLARTKLR
jgi:hypothetical protein